MNININGVGFNTGNGHYNRRRHGTHTSHAINKPWQSILFCAIFLIIGIGLLIFGINSNMSFKEKSNSFIETNATVVDYDYDTDGLAAIIVEYNVDGENYKRTSNSRSSHPKSIGSVVKIKYNPNNPADMIWMSNNGNIMIPLVGFLFIIAGGIGVFTSVRKGLRDGFNSGTNETITYTYDRFGNRHIQGQNTDVPSRFDYSNQMNQYTEQNYNMGQNQNNDFSQMNMQNNNHSFQSDFNSNNQDNNNLNNF